MTIEKRGCKLRFHPPLTFLFICAHYYTPKSQQKQGEIFLKIKIMIMTKSAKNAKPCLRIVPKAKQMRSYQKNDKFKAGLFIYLTWNKICGILIVMLQLCHSDIARFKKRDLL